MTELPPNIEAFHTIMGLIFARLYQAFPTPINLNREEIAEAMGGIVVDDKQAYGQFLAKYHHTITWLVNEGFIRSPVPYGEGATLSARGLNEMNAMPSGLEQSLGSELVAAAAKAPTQGRANRIAELVGNFFGGFFRSFTDNC